MKPKKIAKITALFFIILGVLGLAARVVFQEPTIDSRQKKGWILTYHIKLHSLDPGAKMSIRLPNDTWLYRIASESFAYENMSVSFDSSKRERGRLLNAVQLIKTTSSELNAEIELQRRTVKKKAVKLKVEERNYYLNEAPKIQTNHPELIKLTDQFLKTKADKRKLIETVFRYIDENIQKSPEYLSIGALKALEEKQANDLGRARLMIALCRTLKIPARLVTGFNLAPNQDAQPRYWIEVYYKNTWNAFDPAYGHEWSVPAAYLPISRNIIRLVSFNGNYDVDISYGIKPAVTGATAVRGYKGLNQLLNLERLPIGMRNVVSIVLLLPIGVLITAIYRNLIGLQAFGTFAPSLLALSFVMSDWRTGLAILAIVLAVGYIGRSYLDRMKLLMVPRIGLILTLVIVMMTMAISVFDYYNLTPSPNAVLLPTVIIAMLIERIFITEMEDGTQHVFKLLMGTILVAFSCFIVFYSSILRSAIISYPEILFFVVAGLIFLGRYSGYRLSELKRFRDLAN